MLTFALSSCEKVIEFDGDQTESYMVMISKPNTENPWKVRLTESRFFLYNDTIATIKGADVSIEVNGHTPNSIVTNQGNGMYNLNYTPQPGDSLTLHVSVAGKGTMTAGCRMPQRAVISGLSCTYDTTHNTTDYYGSPIAYASGAVTARLTIDDPANEDNYYILKVIEPTLEYNYLTRTYDTVYKRVYVTVEDNVLFDMSAVNEVFDPESNDNTGYTILFTDEHINGHSHTIAFNFNTYSIAEKSRYVEVYTLSRDRYLYEKTLQAAQGQDVFTNLISEPVQVHSNVTGGLGILGGASIARVKLD